MRILSGPGIFRMKPYININTEVVIYPPKWKKFIHLNGNSMKKEKKMINKKIRKAKMRKMINRKRENVKRIFSFAISVFLLLWVLFIFVMAAGCQKNIPCLPNDDIHQWQQWSNSWDNVNGFGWMKQERKCKSCGLYDTIYVH